MHSSKAVKPTYGSGSGSGAPSATDDAIPLTVFDKANFDQYISGIFFFHPPAPSNAVLEAGLAKALAAYCLLADRLGTDANGNRVILLNDSGARFVEATADVDLGAVMPWKPTPEVLSLHPSDDAAEELMMVPVTRFACGSLAVGYTMQHVVADGPANCNCLLAWARQATCGISRL